MCLSQDELKEKVAAMGGSFDVNLTTSTTHLAAASSDTEKYRVATEMKACATMAYDVRRDARTRTPSSL